jgi:hypothetical protein
LKTKSFSQSYLKPSKDTKTQSHEAEDVNPAPDSPTPNFGPLGGASVARKPLRPADVLALQRTIGNQAVQRLLKHEEGKQAFQSLVNHTAAQANPAAKPAVERQTGGSGVIQRLPSSRTFEKGWNKKTSGAFSIDVFEEKKIQKKYFPGKKEEKLDENLEKMGKANILAAYKTYDKENSKANLSELFHAVTYWETLNYIHSDQAWHQPAMAYLDELKENIKTEMQARVDKSNSKTPKIISTANPFQKVPWSRANQASKIKSWSAEKSMPQFLKEVGLSSQYFNTNLDGKPAEITALYDYYLALKSGSTTKAAAAYTQVKDLPNMTFIRPLFVVHFADKLKMDDVFDTDAQSTLGQPVSTQELAAITKYTGGDYITYNSELRKAGSVKRGTPKLAPGADATAKQKHKKQKDDQKALETEIKLAVSGLNKMPKFNGVAYRGFMTEPAKGYLDLVQPGALIVDLAFSSASSSFEGSRYYLNQAPGWGTKHIYFMIHTRTAVNVVEHAKIKKEGEVLFRPGTKFQVKALWEHVKGRIPRNAPPEAQMMLQSLGPEKAELNNVSGTDKFISGKSAKEIQAQQNKNAMFAPSEDQKKAMTWNPVKVIEAVEI